MRDTKTMSGHTPEKLSIGDHATDLLRCAVTEIVPTPVTGRWYALTQEREHAAEIVRRWNAHADLVAALRRIAACTDPQGEWRDDADLDPAACVELARSAIAKAGGA